MSPARITGGQLTPRVSETQRLEVAMKKQRRQAKKLERESARTAAASRTPMHEGPTRGTSTMSRGDFYAWCKRTGQLALYFRLYPEG